ncbi:MAG: glycosyltransferase family 9 protein [Planctomycetia bacterium]|nr:glycosyltransferase family 9 protein [Planctomycetia bacterium]
MKRLGLTPPKGSPAAKVSPTPGAPAPEAPLRLQGETTRVEKPAPAAPVAPPSARPGHPSIDFDRILIVRLSALGDCVHVLPAFANLRKAFPHSKIAWAIEDRFASLLDGLPGLDQVLVFPRRQFRGVWWRPWLWPSAMMAAMRTARALKSFAPTVAFDFQGNLKSSAHVKLCGAPTKIGLAQAKEGAEQHYTHRVQIEGTVHRVERGLELLRAAEVPVTASRISPTISERDRAAIEGWLREKGARHTIVCHVGTSAFGAFKRWPAQKWGKVGALLTRGGHRTVLFAWGPGERDIAEAATNAAASERVFTGPDTPRIGTLAALIVRSSAFIGCDSGPLHLAAMMDKPVVGLYGPKDPAVYGPWCDRHVVVWKGMPCSPCTKRDCDITDCMDLIEPEEVAAAAEGLLTRIKSPAAWNEEAAGKTLWASGEERWEVGKEDVQ